MTETQWAVFEFLREHIIGRKDPDRLSIGEKLREQEPEAYALAMKAGIAPDHSHAVH